MARVTVEDCVDKIPNRFEIVMMAAHRARMISAGSPILVERNEDKNPVVALREIAEDKITPEELREDAIAQNQKYVEVDEPEEDNMASLMGDDVPEEDINEEEMLRALQAELGKM